MRKRNVLTITVFSVACSFLSLSGLAQSGPDPYVQMGMEDIEKLLSDSPWSQTHDLGIVGGSTAGMVMAGSFTVRLRSARQIRVGLVRLRQLKARYDKMNDKDKAAFDEKNKPLIDCPACDENYVVSLSPGPGSQGLFNGLKTMTLSDAKLNIQLLNDQGESRELVHYAAPKAAGEDAVFFFSRLNQKGDPLVTPRTRSINISLGQKILGSTGPQNNFVFPVSRIVVNGQVSF